MNQIIYDLLDKTKSSIYVGPWRDTFPDCLVWNYKYVYTKAKMQIDRHGPCPRGFEPEVCITTINKRLRFETCTVPEDDLCLPYLSGDYSESPTVDNETKRFHNLLLAEHAQGAWIVLDDVDGKSTEALRAAGITDITVPSPHLEHLEGATIYPGLLLMLVLNMPVKPCSFYFDYTCSWAGSRTGIMPQVDIAVALMRWLLDADGILAVTVCMRHLPLEKRRTHLNDMQADIERMGKSAGYAFERVYGVVYRNNYMAFLVLRSVPVVRVEEPLSLKRKRKSRAFFMDETHGGLKRSIDS